MPSNMDLPMSGAPHLNSRIAVWEMNFICFFVGRLKRALLITDWTLSFPNFKRCCTRHNHTCKKILFNKNYNNKKLRRLRVCLALLHGTGTDPGYYRTGSLNYETRSTYNIAGVASVHASVPNIP